MMHRRLITQVCTARTIANAREKVGLTTSIAIKGREPTAPFLLGSLRLFEIDDDWIIQARKKSVVDDRIIFPSVDRPSDIVVRLLNKLGSFLQVESRALDVVKLKVVLLKNQADASCLHPQKGREEKMENCTRYSNHRK
jgi:hypothetical protein